MGVDLSLDDRYKIDKKDLDIMRRLRNSGLSYQKIADIMQISSGEAYYWLNDKYRERKRALNAKRISSNKKRIKQKVKQDKRFRLAYALGYIAKEVSTYKYSKKEDVKILGISMRKHWIPFLEKHWKKGARKLGV